MSSSLLLLLFLCCVFLVDSRAGDRRSLSFRVERPSSHRFEIFGGGDSAETEDSQALHLGFKLALKERDTALREQARTQDHLVEAHRHLDALTAERDQALRSLDSLSASRSPSLKGKTSVSRAQDADEPHLVEESGDNVVWQIHKVTLQRVENYGFGIAVSGGHDSPHFASGDPSIAISDVLKAGPAEGKLQLNDRIISVNGVSLENVSHSMAIQVLRNSGDSVHLVVRRRIVMPAAVEKESPPLRVTLIKKNKKDEFGLVLGCHFYIQDVLPDSLAAQDGGVKIGDTILKVNNTPLEGLSVTEVRKVMERSKERLQLIVSKSTYLQDRARSSANRLRDDEGYATFRPPHDKDDVNLYRPADPPPGMYPPLPGPPSPFDARYAYDQDAPAPPRPVLPGTFPRSQHRNEGPHSPTRERAENFYSPAPRRDPDGYYSDHDMDGYRGPPQEEMFARSPHDDTDIRRVVFQKDRHKGLGLRLAGGNATGIFIASVQPGTAAQQQGLVEGDQILQANGLDIVGLTREEAVAHLTSLEGHVTLLVQYRKEDYESIMASHEAGDSFYIRTHFTYQPSTTAAATTMTSAAGEGGGDHAFKVGDIFHIKDTLFRGVGGSWLAIRVGPNGEELKKGTIPNRKKAESLAAAQQQNSSAGRDILPSKGKGSLFKRKSARRAKSLSKDHWEEVIFSGLSTKFPPYERVVLRDPAFVRPVVVFGAIADVARDMLLREFPDRFESPQVEKGAENDPKKGKTGIIRFGAIREAIDRKKHCVLDVTPYHVDRLNYAQYYPMVLFLKGDSKTAIKDVRSRWKGAPPGGTAKNPKKLAEHNDRMESLYSHLFTGVITHTATDVWFPKLVEMITAQQRRPVWMSEKKPDEDFNDDFMFPMPNRMSIAHTPEHDLDLDRPADDLDISPTQKKRLVRSSSDPSVNTADRVPGIPPYPAPPGYGQDRRLLPYEQGREEWDDYRHPVSPHDREDDWQMHPDDRYYPHPHRTPPEVWSPHYPPSPQPPAPHPHHPNVGGVGSRSSIDVYTTISASDRARRNDYPPPHDDYGPPRDELFQRSGPRSPHDTHLSHSLPPGDHRGYNEGSSNDNDSYNRYVSTSPANKHDDSKLRDKFSSLHVGAGGGGGVNPGSHDPYRFTRSTANPVSSANIDRVKLSHLTAKYRQEERHQGKPGASKGGSPLSPTSAGGPTATSDPPIKKKEPPPVPVKTYSLKEVGMDTEEIKARNYENSNRSYNYSEVHYPGQQGPQPPPLGGSDPRYPPDPSLPQPPGGSSDSPYEYISTRNLNNARPGRRGEPMAPEIPPLPLEGYVEGAGHSRAFSNSVYMDQREVDRTRQGMDGDPGGYMRPRTDDEQLRDLQVQRRNRSRLRSEPPLAANRAKSEPHLDKQRSSAPLSLTTLLTSTSASTTATSSRWNKYKSWDSEKEGQRTFDAYKKLITPGFYSSRKVMSKSHDELREESGDDGSSHPRGSRGQGGPSQARGGGGSAFESYRKVSSSSSLPPTGRSRPADDTFIPGRDGLTEDSLPSPALPLPPPPPPSSRPAFTEMPPVPSPPLPPPPPISLTSLLTAFPARKVKANGNAPEVTDGSGRGGPILRQLSANERRSRGLDRSRMKGDERRKDDKRSSADLERRWVTGRNARNKSDVGDWMRGRSADKGSPGGSAKRGGSVADSAVTGKGWRFGKTSELLNTAEVRPSVSKTTAELFKSAEVRPWVNKKTAEVLNSAEVRPWVNKKTAEVLNSAEVRPWVSKAYPRLSQEVAAQRRDTQAASSQSVSLPSHQQHGTPPVGNRVCAELHTVVPPVNSDLEFGRAPDSRREDLPSPPPTSPSEAAENGKMAVSEQLSSDLPLPPPPPSHAQSLNGTVGEQTSSLSSSSQLPLPPPPPSLALAEAAHTSSSPASSGPLRDVPPPPPPPALVTTPLFLVNGEGEEGEGRASGKMLLRRLSGPNHIPLDDRHIAGEESKDGETSESVSTPDTVVVVAAPGPPWKETEDGQTVVATARGVFTSAGGVLKSEETGVSIVIPEGALEAGTSQEIYFKVCSGNSILPPLDEDKGETLLSPLVMCGPHGLRFKKPVELKLPHSASVNPHSWSFALKSSDSPSGRPTQWQNMTLAGSEGVSQGHVNQTSVSVLVDHF